MVCKIRGVHSWSGGRAEQPPHRTYSLTWLIESGTDDGPANVMQTPLLPLPGSTWNFGSDVDDWAYCTPYMKAKSVQEGDGERATLWHLEQQFTTKPMLRCNDISIENPLDEPPAVRGSFIPYSEEAITDRFGNYLLMSSLERIRGEQVMVEKGRPCIHITINEGTLPLAMFSEFRGAVNDSTLWGLPPRTIRLADISWERNVFGVCGFYYRITYSFEIKFETWNRFIIDEGTRVKMLKTFPISDTNPLIPYVDPYTQKPARAYLDGSANAIDVYYGDPGDIFVHEKEIEPQYNFLLLNIPTSF